VGLIKKELRDKVVVLLLYHKNIEALVNRDTVSYKEYNDSLLIVCTYSSES